jgi:polysaccharide biosynthesis protein PelA
MPAWSALMTSLRPGTHAETELPLTRRLFVSGLAGLPIGLAAAKAAAQVARQRFLVYYGAKFETVADSYDMVVLDDNPGAAALVNRRPATTFLNYISLAEIHVGRPYFRALQARGIVGEPSPDWPDSRFLDLRNPAWAGLVIEELVPRALSRGYKGIFLDTIDSAEAMERRDPARNAGMVRAASSVLRDIRKAFPQIRVMVNRGYAALPAAVGAFDMLLGESLHSTFGPSPTDFHRQTASDVTWQRSRMLEARGRDPRLELYCLDYWDPQDVAGIARLYLEARTAGVIPYVGTPDLTRVVPEPVTESRS